MTAATGVRPAVERDGARPRRVIEQRRGLPGSRAVVGGLLMAVAAIGVFAAYTDATSGSGVAVVVAARDLRVGHVIGDADLRSVAAELPGATRHATFDSPRALLGRVVLGPIAEGEIVQAGALTSEASTDGHEVAMTLPREQVAVGRLREGERVDVYVTYEERTSSVVRGAAVVQIAAGSERSLTSEHDVSLVVALGSAQDVVTLVHALRTGDVTVVRSTFAGAGGEPLVFEASPDTSPAADPSGSGR
ncbi:MAG: SAF domain-containing protein [Acidimicrobiales bacterium]